MKLKITPGEWVTDCANPEMVAVLKDGIYKYICDCATDLHDGYITQEQELANAQLIAKAPVMYKYLEMAHNTLVRLLQSKNNKEVCIAADREGLLISNITKLLGKIKYPENKNI